jgi:hypothetical protein
MKKKSNHRRHKPRRKGVWLTRRETLGAPKEWIADYNEYQEILCKNHAKPPSTPTRISGS